VSTKEQLVIPFPPVGEGGAGVQKDDHASANDRRDESDTGSVRERGGDGPAAKTLPIPQNRRELALAIFAQCDPVALGRALLENGEDRSASVRLRSLEMFTEWAYDEGEREASPAPTRLIWDLPRRGEHREEGNGADPESREGGQQ